MKIKTLFALVIGLVLLFQPVPAGAAPKPPPTPGRHSAKSALPVKDRPPTPASKDAQRQVYGHPVKTSHRRPSMRLKAAVACNVGDFTSKTGAALVQQIKAVSTDCVNTLFNLTGTDANKAFREAQMVTVANALRTNSANYPGDDSTSTAQLVLYLRAGYYVQWYHSGDVGTYGQALITAIQGGLDAFYGNAKSSTVSDANGEVLAEAVTLIDSAQQNDRYLYVVKRLLNGYNSSYDASWWMLNAVNNVYTVLWRGHQLPAFVSAVQADPSVLDTLSSFALNHLNLLGGDNSYLDSNAGLELGRFLQHATLKAKVKPLAIGLLSHSSMTGTTAPLWVGVAQMADAYDKAACADYGTCNLQQRLSDAVLSITYTCSSSIKIRAQALTSDELTTACNSLKGQDAYFHGLVKDSGPVANDHNTTIEVCVFHSSTDYQTYAGVIFGIDTNNGGMYLEGDPSAAGNQPRFIAYEAEWVRPAFQIWNLNHEYTHYLDGRFDMYGDFDAGVTTPTIWWIEGFAEYVSYSYRKVTYDDAIAQAGLGTYSLSTLFDTDYNADETRVYNWGYLAVRYMFERHYADLTKILGYYRTGDWNGARSYLTGTIGTRYNADFASWLHTLSGGSTTTPECTGSDTRQLDQNCARSNLSASTGNYSYLYVNVPPGTQTLTIKSTGGTGNADLYYNASSWATTSSYTKKSTASGNEETLTITNPPAGYNYISLYGTQAFSGVSVETDY